MLNSSRIICFSKYLFRKHVKSVGKPLGCMSTVSSGHSEAEANNQDAGLSNKKQGSNIPFAKDLFLGKFDCNMLVFPEVLSSSELQDLNEMVQPIERFFSEQLDSKAIDVNAKISEEVLTQVKELGLFGMQIPQQYGGLGLNSTQYARINEFCSIDASIAVTLAAHQAIGLKGILLFGTEEQKEQYLPKLATGENTAAFCLTEPSSGSDAASIQTKATLSEDGKTFNLNGGKIWISNGGLAEVFTVFARTEVKDAFGEVQDMVSAFIVERSFGGITNGKPEDKLGIRGSNTCEVHFDNTPVPVENLLGELGEGFKIAVTILNSGRFSMGSSSAGGIRKLMELVCDHAVNRKQFGRPLKDFGLIQEKFAKMAISAYVMESMAYATAAIMDTHENPDASVEAAMVKVYSSEEAWTCINEALQIMGGAGYMKDYPFERYLRDARILLIFEGTNEILRLYIALTGLQHAGNYYKKLLIKLNDPLNNMGLVFSKAVERFTNKPSKLKMKLYDHVHPVLSHCAEALEMRLNEFNDAVQLNLGLYKGKIIEEQMLCKRLADVSTDLYAMTCVLARASRSKAIGLRNCDHEMNIACVFCQEASDRIEKNLKAVKMTKYNNGDEQYRMIAEDIFKNGGYVAEHPLTRNWD